MISAAYDKLISIYLSKIISSIDIQQREIQVKDGKVELQNVVLSPMFLIQVKFPVLVENSLVKKIAIQINEEATETILLITISEFYIFSKQNQNGSHHFKGLFTLCEIPQIFNFMTSKFESFPRNLIHNIRIQIDQIYYLHYTRNFFIYSNMQNVNFNRQDKSLFIPSVTFHLLSKQINMENLSTTENFMNFMNVINNSTENALLRIAHFSLSFSIKNNVIQVKCDPIHCEILNKEIFFIHLDNDYFQTLWSDIYDSIPKPKTSKLNYAFKFSNALQFLRNRETFLQEIQTSQTSKIFDSSNHRVKNSFISYINSKISFGICHFNLNLYLPSISLSFEKVSMTFNQIQLQDRKFTINDMFFNNIKVSVTKPFLTTQLVNNSQIFTISKLTFQTKSDDGDFITLFSQIFELIKSSIKLLSFLFSPTKSVLNFQEIRISIENSNDTEQLNEFVINSILYDLDKKEGDINCQGGTLNHDFTLLPFQLTIIERPFTHSISLQSNLINLNFKNHDIFLKKTEDFRTSIRQICHNFNLDFSFKLFQIQQKQFNIQVHNFLINSHQKSYQRVEFNDKTFPFLSFDSYKIENNCIEFSNLSVILIVSQLKLLLSFTAYDQFIAHNFSIQLPNSDLFIYIETVKFNQNLEFENFSIQTPNRIIAKPLTFSIKKSQNEMQAEISKLDIEINKEELEKIIELFEFIYKSQLNQLSIRIQFNQIDIALKEKLLNDAVIGHFVINSAEFSKTISENETNIILKALNITDLNEQNNKSIECNQPIEIQLRKRNKQDYQISSTLNNLQLYFSPYLFSFYLCILKSHSCLFFCNYNLHITNSMLSFYNDSNRIIGKIEFEQLSLMSQNPENLTFSVKNLKVNSKVIESIEFQVVDSLFTFASNSIIELNLTSQVFEDILEFCQKITINSTLFVSIGQNLSIKSIQVNLTDLGQSFLINEIKSTVNSIQKRGHLFIAKISLTNQFDIENLNFFYEFRDENCYDELNSNEFNNLDSLGDVFNPFRFSYVQLLLNIDRIALKTHNFSLTKKLIDCYYSQKFISLIQSVTVKSFSLIHQFYETLFSFSFTNLQFKINETEFKLLCDDLQISPNELIVKQSNQNEFISVLKTNSKFLIEIKPCIFKFDLNLAIFIFSVLHFIEPSESIVFKTDNLSFLINTEYESPLNLNLDLKISKKLKKLSIKTNIHSIYFFERKPVLKNTQFKIKIDDLRHFHISLSNTTIYLTSYISTILSNFFSNILKKLDNMINFELIVINSISIDSGDLSIVICPLSFEPKYRFNFSAFSISINHNQDSEFEIQSCIQFINDRIHNWDYLIEPFTFSIQSHLSNDQKALNHINVKMMIKNELNLNIPLSIFYETQNYHNEIDEFIQQIKKQHKISELPLFFIRNNLDVNVSIKLLPDNGFFILESQQIIPIFLNSYPTTFELTLNDQVVTFTNEDIIYPIIFGTHLSVNKKGHTIELNSPVQIKSFIACHTVYLYEKRDDNFVLDIGLENLQSYPLYFNSNKPKEIVLLFNNQIQTNLVKPEIISISPFTEQSEINEFVSIENDHYKLLIKTENDKCGKIVKLYSAVVCENLLPTTVFIKAEKSSPIVADKNQTIDLITVSSEIGSAFRIELSMNGADYSISNKIKIELYIDNEPNKLKNLSIYDCRIQKEIVINAKFLKLPNGQLKMVLLSPVIFTNLTETVFHIDNKLISSLNWSILNPFYLKSNQLEIESSHFPSFTVDYSIDNKEVLFLKKENMRSRRSDAGDVKVSFNAFHSLKSLFTLNRNRFNDQKTSEIDQLESLSVEPLNLRFQNYFIPLIITTQRHPNDKSISIISFSYLIRVCNNTDIPIECDFVVVQPHTNEKIGAIKNENMLCFKFMNSQDQKVICLDILSSSFFKESFGFMNDDTQEKFVMSFSYEDNSYIITFNTPSYPPPLMITNQISSDLISNNENPISVSIYQSNPNKSLEIPFNSTTPFYLSDFRNLDSINLHFEYTDNSQEFWSKNFTISIEHETGPIEILKANKDLSFYVTVHKFKTFKLINLSTKLYNQPPLEFIKGHFEIEVPKMVASIIDTKMNEVLLMTMTDLLLNINHEIFSKQNNIMQSKSFKFNIKSVQIDSQSNQILDTDEQFSILKIIGNDEDSINLTLFMNEYSKFCKIEIKNDLELCLDSASIYAIRSFLYARKSYHYSNQFDWLQISPISLHLSYINKKASVEGGTQRRRSSFINFDVQTPINIQTFDLIQIPGIVFGQFDGDYLISLAYEYIENYIRPQIQSLIIFDDYSVPVVSKHKDFDNRQIVFDHVNKSALIVLALCLTKSNIDVPFQYANVIGSLPSYNKMLEPFSNGFILHYQANCLQKEKETGCITQLQNRLPRCFPQFRIGQYNSEESEVLLLIRNRFRMKEGVRFVAKCTLTNNLVALTDRFLIIINPTIEYFVDEISFLDIASVVVLQNEIRISGRKQTEKLTFRFNDEHMTMRFNVFIASQKIALGMFGMSMIDK